MPSKESATTPQAWRQVMIQHLLKNYDAYHNLFEQPAEWMWTRRDIAQIC